MNPIIAISAGDMNGVGPEVVLKAFSRSELFEVCRPVVFGSLAALEWHKARLGSGLHLRVIDAPSQSEEGVLSVIDTGGDFDESGIGRVAAAAGMAAVDAVRQAAVAALEGGAEAIVTAPVSKEAISSSGAPFTGHTELLASLCGCDDQAMMILSSNTMKVGLVTIHAPLREVAGLVTRERVHRALQKGAGSLEKDFGIGRPRIAVLALNPHAGDGGTIGAEESEHIQPAVNDAVAGGLRVEGPFPADGFFSAHNREMYDMIVAMYHDQGLIPFKMQARGRGVNVTAGLPIVRTSPDHGTAFNIAGRGIADAESMKEAIRAARSIAVNRRRLAAT